MIRATETITLNENEIEERFIRASGPGGQNVNKLSSAVQLRFDARHSPSLPPDVRARLEQIAGHMVTKDGVVVITAQRHRTQDMNRRDARQRLVDLIRRAAVRPKKRRATKPTKGSKQRRLEGKKARGAIKRMRGRGGFDD
ncbi:MAG: aminoacyl-tRNA hydrolase [Alphaproteobacteria bacterium]|nr:aminoacyl-tRNA hydrolase [Alphaproteobacteria bacterium]